VNKKMIFVAVLLLGTMSSMARADQVSYSTKWDLSIAPTSQNFLNTMNLAFVGAGLDSLFPITVDAPAMPSPGVSSSLGYFLVTGALGTDFFDELPFDLVIKQYAPSATPNSGVFSSTLQGKISRNKSDLWITFADPSVRIGNVIYTLEKQDYFINANAWPCAGKTEIDADIQVTPEPGSLLLFGSGLALLAVLLRRRVLSGKLISGTAAI